MENCLWIYKINKKYIVRLSKSNRLKQDYLYSSAYLFSMRSHPQYVPFSPGIYHQKSCNLVHAFHMSQSVLQLQRIIDKSGKGLGFFHFDWYHFSVWHLPFEFRRIKRFISYSWLYMLLRSKEMIGSCFSSWWKCMDLIHLLPDKDFICKFLVCLVLQHAHYRSGSWKWFLLLEEHLLKTLSERHWLIFQMELFAIFF